MLGLGDGLGEDAWKIEDKGKALNMSRRQTFCTGFRVLNKAGKTPKNKIAPLLN